MAGAGETARSIEVARGADAEGFSVRACGGSATFTLGGSFGFGALGAVASVFAGAAGAGDGFPSAASAVGFGGSGLDDSGLGFLSFAGASADFTC